MERNVEEWFQVKNDKKNTHHYLKKKKLIEKKFEKKNNIFNIFLHQFKF